VEITKNKEQIEKLTEEKNDIAKKEKESEKKTHVLEKQLIENARKKKIRLPSSELSFRSDCNSSCGSVSRRSIC